MKKLALAAAVATLLVIVAAPLAYLSGSISLEICKGIALAATLVWFVAAFAINMSQPTTADVDPS